MCVCVQLLNNMNFTHKLLCLVKNYDSQYLEKMILENEVATIDSDRTRPQPENCLFRNLQEFKVVKLMWYMWLTDID